MEEQEEVYEVVSIREFSRRVGLSDTAIKKYYLDTLKIPETARTLSKGGQPRLFYELAKEAYLQYNPTAEFDESTRAVPGDPVPEPEPVVKEPKEKRPRILTPKRPQTKHTGAVSLSDRKKFHKEQRQAEQGQLDLEPEPETKEKKTRYLPPAPEPNEMDTGKLEILESEKREKSAKARMAEMNLAERQGKLVDKAKQDKALFQLGIEIRDKIMAVPKRVVDLIRAADDRNEAELLLTIELGKTLNALSEFKG